LCLKGLFYNQVTEEEIVWVWLIGDSPYNTGPLKVNGNKILASIAVTMKESREGKLFQSAELQNIYLFISSESIGDKRHGSTAIHRSGL
jgi:hypothetical protein